MDTTINKAVVRAFNQALKYYIHEFITQVYNQVTETSIIKKEEVMKVWDEISEKKYNIRNQSRKYSLAPELKCQHKWEKKGKNGLCGGKITSKSVTGRYCCKHYKKGDLQLTECTTEIPLKMEDENVKEMPGVSTVNDDKLWINKDEEYDPDEVYEGDSDGNFSDEEDEDLVSEDDTSEQLNTELKELIEDNTQDAYNLIIENINLSLYRDPVAGENLNYIQLIYGEDCRKLNYNNFLDLDGQTIYILSAYEAGELLENLSKDPLYVQDNKGCIISILEKVTVHADLTTKRIFLQKDGDNGHLLIYDRIDECSGYYGFFNTMVVPDIKKEYL